jgi:hypothetical protein
MTGMALRLRQEWHWHLPHWLAHAHHPLVEPLAVAILAITMACTAPNIPLQPATGYSMDYTAAGVTRVWRISAPAGQPDRHTVLKLHDDGMLALSGVPWFHQGTDRTCAQANIATLLNFWGHPQSYPSIVAEMNPGNLPTDVNRISSYLRQKGLKAQDYRLASLNFLRQQVNQGRPTLVLLDFGSLATTHYVTVKGYDEAGTRLLINDPVAGPNLVMAVDEFQRLWRNRSLASVPGIGDKYRFIAFDVQGS